MKTKPLILTFLGTGTSQGVPVIACDCPVCRSQDPRDQRLRSSVMIEKGETMLVIDTGPDFRQQMLRHQVKKLHAVLYTHEHKDHVAGLDEVRSFNFAQKTDMPLYGQARVFHQLQQEFAYIFAPIKYPGVPSVTLHEITNRPFEVGDLAIEPVEALHYRLPVFGYKFGSIAYVTDAKTIAPAEQQKLKGLDILILNALQKEAHLSHLTLSEALALIQALKPKKAYLTHISHKLGLHQEVQKALPPNIHLAHDGLTLQA